MEDKVTKKEYLPGYTGHVPKRKIVIGCTDGEINRQLMNRSNKFTNFTADNLIGREKPGRSFYNALPETDPRHEQALLGNKSKYEHTWIGGHTQNIKPQHIPGYQGHIPGMVAENMYAKTYGRTTASAILKDPPSHGP